MKNKKLSICSLICGDASQSTALLHEVLLHILFSIFLLVVSGTNVILCEPVSLGTDYMTHYMNMMRQLGSKCQQINYEVWHFFQTQPTPHHGKTAYVLKGGWFLVQSRM